MSGMFGNINTDTRRKSVEWYTPQYIFDALGLEFDLDPASPADFKTCVPAAKKLTIYDDGLKRPWYGRVWLNPPYGRETPLWMRRMIAHRNGVALVFSRTDAAWFQECMQAAHATLFMSGRIEFIPGHENSHKRGRSGAGTAMFAFDSVSAEALAGMRKHGVLMVNKGVSLEVAV